MTMITIEEKQIIPTKNFLHKSGLYGLSHLEPIIMASLVSESPVLLIGSPGTAKTMLFEKLSTILDLRFKHYNASQVCIDDLIGYPTRSKTGNIEFAPTPASCWDAEAVFIDEISRCKPETQNKFFSIIHEKKLSGIPLVNLRYRWAAMNPPKFDDDDQTPESLICEGAFPLDMALADRFNYIIKFPEYYDFCKQDRLLVISPGEDKFSDETINTFSKDITDMIEDAKNRIPFIHKKYKEAFTYFVYNFSNELKKCGYHITGRRAKMIFNNLIWTTAASQTLSINEDIAETIILVAKNSLPFRAYMKIDDLYVETAARRSIVISDITSDIKKVILLEPEPVERVFIALENYNKIENTFINQLIEDLVSKLNKCEKISYVLNAYRALCDNYTLSASVADELSILFQEYVSPIKIDDEDDERHIMTKHILMLHNSDTRYRCLSDFTEEVQSTDGLKKEEIDAIIHAARVYLKDESTKSLSKSELDSHLKTILNSFTRYSARFGEIVKKLKHQEQSFMELSENN